MRTTQAAKYARWSAMLAALLAAFVASSYVRRAWQLYQARREAPSSVPSAIRQQSSEFSYSKVIGDHTEFTVRASRATEFAGGGRAVLQDVWVTVYGKQGQRMDNLHTQTCEFLSSAGTILCAGDVQIDLQSAEDARLFPGTPENPNPAAHIMRVRTSKVSFNRDTGTTATDEPVIFRFPQGQGRAIGLRYESQQGEVRLLRSVELTFLRPAAREDRLSKPDAAVPVSGEANDRPLHVTAASLLFRRDERVIHLQGPVEAQQGQHRLLAGHLALELDPMLRAQRIVATDQPRLNGSQRGEPVSVAADELSALFSPEGWTDRLIAVGNARAGARRAIREDRLEAGRIEVEMTAHTNQPRQLTASRNVVVNSDGSGGLRRRLMSDTLEVQFAADPGSGQTRITSAATPDATLDWQAPADPSAKALSSHMRLSSRHLDAIFGGDGELREVRGSGGVEIERQVGSAPPQTSTSREMIVRVVSGGDWSSVDQSGDVRLRQMDRVAQADRAHFDRMADAVVLSGSVVLADPQSRLTAQSGTFHQLTNEFRADGRVVTSEVPAASGGTSNFAPSPARISADRLVVNTSTGHAVYSGQARLWQGDSFIEADHVELDRPTRTLVANGRVRAVFPQASWMPSGDHPLAKTIVQSAGKPEFLRVEAGRLTYESAEGRARLEQRVTTHSAEGTIRADTMDLFLAPATAAHQESVAVPGAKSGAGDSRAALQAQQLVRAAAVGNVVVEQGDRRGTSSQAEYTASEGKFVLSGGPPIVRDTSGNSITGRQLTLFFADDRIVVDSAEGSRTLTLHTVEK